MATEKARRPTIRQRVRQLRRPSFPAPFDRISDPQIPQTRQIYLSSDNSPMEELTFYLRCLYALFMAFR
jgi:hypothetical protein